MAGFRVYFRTSRYHAGGRSDRPTVTGSLALPRETPHSLCPASASLREALLRHLREGPRTAHELSGLVGIPEKQVADHLAHVARSLRRTAERLRVDPAQCRDCGFVSGSGPASTGPRPAPFVGISTLDPRDSPSSPPEARPLELQASEIPAVGAVTEPHAVGRLLGALGLAAPPPRSVTRPVTRRRFRRPPPASAVPVCPPTRGSRFAPTCPRVRPGPLWPLPGRPAARESPATLGMRPLGSRRSEREPEAEEGPVQGGDARAAGAGDRAGVALPRLVAVPLAARDRARAGAARRAALGLGLGPARLRNGVSAIRAGERAHRRHGADVRPAARLRVRDGRRADGRVDELRRGGSSGAASSTCSAGRASTR